MPPYLKSAAISGLPDWIHRNRCIHGLINPSFSRAYLVQTRKAVSISTASRHSSHLLVRKFQKRDPILTRHRMAARPDKVSKLAVHELP